MSDADALLYKRLRAETAQLLGYDAASLTTAQSVKVELVASLRLGIDGLAARQLRGETIDLTKLLSASEALERLLPSLAVEQQDAEDQSAQAALLQIIEGYATAANDEKADRIAFLEAQLSEANATIAALSGTPATTEQAPPASPKPTAEVVPLRPKAQSAHEAWVEHVYGGGGVTVPALTSGWDRQR
jgi:hypothetical protein